MKSLLNPDHTTLLTSSNPFPVPKPLSHPISIKFPTVNRRSNPNPGRQIHLRQRCRSTTVKAVMVDSSTLDHLGLPDSGGRNPAVSTSYRSSHLPRPNQTVLEAQTRVCTGPTQTKPLSEEQAFKVLDTILKSARGELKNEDSVSKAQLGAFFAGMTIRANAFPEATQWSEGERRAMDAFWPELIRALPHDVIFIADPEGSIMGVGSIGPQYTGQDAREMRLVGALREVLAGGHLGFEEVQGVLRDALPLKSEDDKLAGVSESLLSAFLIGQRMNRETDRELKAYCLAFDDEVGNVPNSEY